MIYTFKGIFIIFTSSSPCIAHANRTEVDFSAHSRAESQLRPRKRASLVLSHKSSETGMIAARQCSDSSAHLQDSARRVRGRSDSLRLISSGSQVSTPSQHLHFSVEKLGSQPATKQVKDCSKLVAIYEKVKNYCICILIYAFYKTQK